jgi:hypothetical protein
MRINPSPTEVKTIVRQAFEEFGVPERLADRLEETIRLDRGAYVARCYRAAGLMAMWLISAGVIQFYDRKGRMLLTIRLWQERTPCGQAA